MSGTTNGCSIGVITSSPSTAESTEIAGVIIASPKNIAAPKMPRPTSHQRSRPWRSVPRETSAVSARMPPSPWLSARMISITYLSVTTITSAQNTRDRRPKTLACVERRCRARPPNTSRIVYSGEVPMSP